MFSFGQDYLKFEDQLGYMNYNNICTIILNVKFAVSYVVHGC